jgi:hypothetical protein
MSHFVVSHMRKCLTAKKLALNLYKTNIVEFISNNSQQYYSYVEEEVSTKCTGLQISNYPNWRNHID